MTHNTHTKMFSPFHLKSLHPHFSTKPYSPSSSSSSALSSTKLKNLIHTLIVSHTCRLIRALSKLKTIVLDIILRHNYKNFNKTQLFPSHNKNRYSNKIIFGSFRLHYNWCSNSKSSHVLPVTSKVYSRSHLCYDSKLNTFVPSSEKQQQEEVGKSGDEDFHELELAGYLQWLEEKVLDDDVNDEKEKMNEIDVLADMFIANCHEKFRLEKQESDRRFQETLARGL